MRRIMAWAFLAAVAVSAGAARSATAQAVPHLDRDTAVVRSRGFNYFYGPDEVRVGSFQRGRLGILVDLSADPARDSIGARVAGVTPGGPADRAGIQAGDIVVRLNGTPLVRRGGGNEDNDDGGAVSRPGTQLIKLASRLDPGDTVKLDLRRAGRPISATLVAQESGADEMVHRGDIIGVPAPGERMDIRIPGGAMNFAFTTGPLASMELVQVNPGLADYFGTSDGLLVVNVGNDSTLGLRDGDVILSIGGRKPGSPAHAMRILGTYDPNETVTFEVMRMKHRVTVNGKMPQEQDRPWTVSPNSFELGPMAPFIRSWGEMESLPRVFLNLPFSTSVPKTGTVRAES